jgi:hypothetical protein
MEKKRQVLDEYGSFLIEGPHYSVLECRGPVSYRQQLASRHEVICYAEAHLNAWRDGTVQHGFCITGDAVPVKTVQWADAFLRRIHETFRIPVKGIVRGVAGQGCVRHGRWPTPTMKSAASLKVWRRQSSMPSPSSNEVLPERPLSRTQKLAICPQRRPWRAHGMRHNTVVCSGPERWFAQLARSITVERWSGVVAIVLRRLVNR